MKRKLLSLRFWSLAQAVATFTSTALDRLAKRCQKRATAANLAVLSCITARR
jgi:hypothetical protein